MEESEQNMVTNLPRPEVAARSQAGPPATGETIFDVRNVSIWYSAFKAVTDVSMSIYEHEITAFIGSSGSGKTTVLRAFNRMNDLVPGARQGGEILITSARRDQHMLELAPFGDRNRRGTRVEHHAELAGCQLALRRPPIAPDVDDNRLVALSDNLEVVCLVQNHAVVGEQDIP